MTDPALLFFLGATVVVAYCRLVAPIHAPAWPLGLRVVVAVVVLSLILIADIVAWPASVFWPSFGPTLIRSLVLGCWIAFLAGCLAGFVIAAALNAMEAWGPAASFTNLAVLAAGPILTILILYVLAMPTAMQGLGLSGIKAGGVEISLSPSPQGVRLDVPSYTNPSSAPSYEPTSEGGSFDKYTPWFQNIWPMFLPLQDPDQKKFNDLGYFQREAAYLKTFDDLTVPMTTEEAKLRPSGAAERIWEQEEFLRSLRPVYGCSGFYHLIFPDVPSLRPKATPLLESLVAVETELEAISSSISIESKVKPAAVALNDVQHEWIDDFQNRQSALEESAGRLVQRFRDAMPYNVKPPSPIFTTRLPEARVNGPSPNWEDCASDRLYLQISPNETPKLDLKRLTAPSGDVDGTIQPPYLAMLIGNSYAALGEKDAGLKVLNEWIKYYEGYGRDFGKDKPRWLYDRAVWEYGVIQEANEPLPTTSQELKYLEYMQTKFATNWQVDLDNQGYKCDDAKAQADLQAQQRAKINAAEQRGSTGEAERLAPGLQARLFNLYSNLLHRLLYATIEAPPSLQRLTITPTHEHWARQLIASADKCLLDESPFLRDARQPQSLFSGGIVLARWAEDGPREGFLHPSTVEDVRKDALRALLTALPLIVDREADESHPDGPFRTSPSQWGSYRRIAEQTILDLEAKLTK